MKKILYALFAIATVFVFGCDEMNMVGNAVLDDPTPVEMPAEPETPDLDITGAEPSTLVNHVTMQEVVGNGLSGAKRFDCKVISLVSAIDDVDLSDENAATFVLTAGEGVLFAVVGIGEAQQRIKALSEGESYRLTLFIFSADPPAIGLTDWTIVAFLLHSEPDTSNLSTYTPLETTPTLFSESVVSGSDDFLGKVITLTAPVLTNSAIPSQLLTLDMSNTNLLVEMYDVSDAGIENLKAYAEGQEYQWTIFILQIVPPTVGRPAWLVKSSKVN